MQVIDAREAVLCSGEVYEALREELARSDRHLDSFDAEDQALANERMLITSQESEWRFACQATRSYLEDAQLKQVPRADAATANRLIVKLRTLDQDSPDRLSPLELIQIANSMPQNPLNLALYVQDAESGRRKIDLDRIVAVVSEHLDGRIPIPDDVKPMVVDQPTSRPRQANDDDAASDEEMGPAADDAILQPEIDEDIEKELS